MRIAFALKTHVKTHPMPNFQYSTFRIDGAKHRPLAGDLRYLNDGQPKPLVIFFHGFKGFKDWGTFNEIAGAIASAGYVFAKFNGSHNGTSPGRPSEFVDLEAFAHNTYSIEVEDLLRVIDWLCAEGHALPDEEIDRNRCILIGHSRGGGISLLAAERSPYVTRCVVWGSVADFNERFTREQLTEWKATRKIEIWNSRTKQNMPLDYGLIEDYHRNLARLEIQQAVKQLLIPVLALHGTEDETVYIEEAENLSEWNARIRLVPIEGANHTFGGSHPWPQGQELPPHSLELIRETLAFLAEGNL